jgi:hypothetical protein
VKVKKMSEERIKGGQIVFQRRDPRTGEDVDDSFDVVVDTKSKVIFVVLYIVFVLLQFQHFSGPDEYWWAPLVFIPMTVVALLLWGFAGPKFAEGMILKWLRRVKERKNVKPEELVFGFPRTKDLYYIEANPNDVNLSNGFVGIKVFLSRVQEVLFLSIGIQAFLSQTLAPYFFPALDERYGYIDISEMMIDTTIYLGPLALLILYLVIPLIWMGEDMQIYRINEYQDNIKLGFYLRASIISKVLGFFGIVLVFNISQQFAAASIGTSIAASTPEYYIAYYQLVIITFVRVLLTCAAPPILVTLLYLTFFHAKWVNNVRIKASEFLPSGTLRIMSVGEEELENLGHPEKIQLQKSFFTSTAGIVILIILAFATLGGAFYMGFIL